MNTWKVDPSSGCWLWTGSVDSQGYGQLTAAGPSGRKAHRVSYILHKGAIPEGMELDHLCRVRHCVNPDHLEPVTHAENMRRVPPALRWRDTSKANAATAAKRRAQTHCLKGHPFDEENTYVHGGKRLCRECRREQVRAGRARRHSAARPTVPREELS